MANYHLEVQPVSRGKGQSLTRRVSYISGRPLHDAYLDKNYYHARDDVLYAQVLLPEGAPPEFRDLNQLCRAVEGAERRWDARTAKSLTGSLPNELSLPEWIPIVETFVRENFTDRGLCAVAAIHQGKNPRCPQQDNPHAHILVSTRAVGAEGFAPPPPGRTGRWTGRTASGAGGSSGRRRRTGPMRAAGFPSGSAMRAWSGRGLTASLSTISAVWTGRESGRGRERGPGTSGERFSGATSAGWNRSAV